MSSLLLSAILGFATHQGQSLELTVALTEPATVALNFAGLVQSSSVAQRRHVFTGLPLPTDRPLDYVLSVGHEPPRPERVRPIRPAGPLRFVVYGDSRDGYAPHRLLLQAISRAVPDLVLHTGDIVRTAVDQDGWREHLLASMQVSAAVPMILALGNHELYVPPSTGPRLDAVGQVLSFIPAPQDGLALLHKAPRGAFRVRVGPALFVILDSNAPIGAGTAQRAFLEAALADRGDAKFLFVAMHQGPLSAGPHGPLLDSEDLPLLFAHHKVTAVFAGHDHTYQRIQRDSVTYIVSGGGGAPLYSRERAVKGLVVFAPAYHWALITLDGDQAKIETRSLEGAVIDEAQIGPLGGTGGDPSRGFAWLAASAGIAGLALLGFAVRLIAGP